MNKQIILARPNLFIVTEMKKMMEDCSFSTHKIEQLADLEHLSGNQVDGLVISTGLHSSITEGYVEAIKKVQARYPDKPILLASMIDTENIKKSLLLNFAKNGLEIKVLTIAEFKERLSFDYRNELLMIKKSDITDQELYKTTKATIKKYFA